MATILIVDDDPNIQLLLAELSDGLGYQAMIAGSLAEGLSLAQKNGFDLILLDLDFPEGNGLEILPALSGLPSVPEIMIITGTGNAESAEWPLNTVPGIMSANRSWSKRCHSRLPVLFNITQKKQAQKHRRF